MTFWLIILVLTFICYFLCAQISEINLKRFVAYFYSAILIFMAGMRSGIGDTGFYISWFNNYKTIPILSLFGSDVKEVGFAMLMATIGKITQNQQIYLMIIALICIGCSFYVICHYSRNIGMSLFLFLTAGFFLGMMNGIRQYIVVSILFLSIHFLLQKKYVPYIVLSLVLSTIHTSALFMIPIFFLVQKPVWKKNTFILLGITLFIILNISTFLPWLGHLLEDSTYTNYTDTLISGSGDGASFFRVLVMFVPVILSFIGRKNFSVNDQEYRIYSNMLILNAICYLFSAQNWIFARLAMYLHIYVLLFYPYILPRLFKNNNLKIITIVLIGLYAVYFLFEVRNTAYMSYHLNINIDLIGPYTRSFY